MAKQGVGIAIALAIGLVAVSAGGAKKKKPSTRQQCIDEWARYVARELDTIAPDNPEGLAIMIQTFEAWGWARTAACLKQRAASPTSLSCYEAVRDDIGELNDPEAFRTIASNAQQAGMPGVASCFNQMAAGTL